MGSVGDILQRGGEAFRPGSLVAPRFGKCDGFSASEGPILIGVRLGKTKDQFRELRLIGIHVGIPWTDEMIAMAWKHENVFIGCDAHAPKHWPAAFAQFINTYGQDKVIFGTDYPALEMTRMRKEIDDLELRPGPLKKLLRDNAIRIYKLDL